MKSYTKSELARAAGVSRDTFRRWLRTDNEFLQSHNVQPKTKFLPPVVVKYLCQKYDIDLWGLVQISGMLWGVVWIFPTTPLIFVVSLYSNSD